MGGEHSEECLAQQHRDNIGFLAGHALAGILASNSSAFQNLTFTATVDLAAKYGEALAKRLDTPSQT